MGKGKQLLARPGRACCRLQSEGAAYKRADFDHVWSGRSLVCDWDTGQEPPVRELSGQMPSSLWGLGRKGPWESHEVGPSS